MNINRLVMQYKRLRTAVVSRLRTWYLRLLGAQVGKNVVFNGPVRTKFVGDPARIIIQDDVTFLGEIDLRNRENGRIIIERGCYIEYGLRLVAARESTIRIGEETTAGAFLTINAGADVTLGRKCILSSYVHISGSGHPTFRDEFIMDQGYIQKPVVIEDDCWLANCVNVLMNTTLRKGVIVGANSVVGGSFKEYSFVVGAPAKVVGERMSRDGGDEVAKGVPKDASNDKLSVPESDAISCLQEIFTELFSHMPVPDPSERLRGNGLIDSLGWLSFIMEVSTRFGVEIPVAVSSSINFDSFEAIKSYLYADGGAEHAEAELDLEIEQGRFHLPDPPVSLYERLLENSKACPDATSVILRDDAGKSICYSRSQLIENGARFASFLMDAGVKEGKRVGIVYPLSENLLAAIVGCLQVGAIPSLHAYPSPKVAQDVYVRNHSKVFASLELDYLYCPGSLHDELSALLPETTELLRDERWLSLPPQTAVAQRKTGDVAIIQHSSGSTGVQKGVALSHEAICRQVAAYASTIDLNEEDVIVSWLPLYHDMGLIACFYMPLLTGVPLVLSSPFEWIANPTLLFDLIEKYRGTLCWLPNFAFNVLATRVTEARRSQLDLSNMRGFVSCSEPVHASAMDLFLRTYENAGIDETMLLSSYAMAENTFAVSQSVNLEKHSFIPSTLDRGQRVVPDESGKALVSQGRPLGNCDVVILDDSGRAAPQGVVGEIALKSDCLFSTYLNNDELADQSFSGGHFKTGDLGFFYEGQLFVTGRIKDLIIVAGRNFYPQDIEDVLTGIAGVKAGRSCAFGVYDRKMGTERVIVMAELVDGSDASRIEQEARRLVTEALDCAIDQIVFVPPGTLVKTSSGKISRSKCKEIFLEREAAAN